MHTKMEKDSVIQSVEVKDFKSHRHSELEFVDGVNVIKGTSHTGKSNIIRAMIWALTNRPRGNSVHNWNIPRPDTKVTFVFDNDWFTRVKSKINGYETFDGTLKAIGSDVPPQIRQIAKQY